MSNQIIREEIELPNKNDKGKYVLGLHNVLTKEECDKFIEISEKMGYSEATVNVGGGRQKVMPDVRNSSRCMWDTPEEADRIWQRIKPFIPEVWRGRKVVGLNERLRILRYDPGQFFDVHMDGNFCRDNGEVSFITMHLYLNEGYEGGSTTFVHRKNAFLSDDKRRGPMEGDVEFHARTGSILLFEHDLLHEGSPLNEGRKYTIRTDVMYDKSVIKEQNSSSQ